MPSYKRSRINVHTASLAIELLKACSSSNSTFDEMRSSFASEGSASANWLLDMLMQAQSTMPWAVLDR
eukprot:5609341-Pleurochrysis_carterae.AAC.1